ncbi:putative methyltransferase [Xenococcus sp. PCC 7305]|uniref:L-histidine N(alpha)-methyltransferase n=1 Tax=Xenococcus sp. PCC 7305 TaxID=102125 RepID=UPI0002ABE8D7|nr:L-histidine N(alpha)-methyltransferase [Xenococcus sp. PCC 7305]ELS03988.1 putative methyltransferase [Xenococcus sp. PCC 7305]
MVSELSINRKQECPNIKDIKERLEINYLSKPNLVNSSDDGQDIIQGLTQPQKTLPARYFYDAKGSQLFEKICELPEYYPTRTEADILEQYATEIANTTAPCDLVELGSGSSTKTRLLLDAYQNSRYPTHYIPIDVSGSILEASAEQLLQDYESLKIRGQVGTYQQALNNLPPSILSRRMVFFLGSSLGNFTPQECDRFFAQIAKVLNPGDYFLLGIDLQKPVDILEAAYNDAQGITAAFNLNMLSHLNWRFGSNFNLELFKHQAIYNISKHQIEMHLHCQENHAIDFKNLDLTVDFKLGTSIRTEISRKFNLEHMQQYLTTMGLKHIKSWSDQKKWFGIVLCQV